MKGFDMNKCHAIEDNLRIWTQVFLTSIQVAAKAEHAKVLVSGAEQRVQQARDSGGRAARLWKSCALSFFN